jgi:putative ATP-dependent endonuclease of the OLD family
VEAGAITKFPKPPVRREALGLLRFDMLDARRDIVEQLRNRRTHWGKATSGLDVADGVRTELEGSLKELGDRVTSGSKVLGNVKEDLRELSQALSHGKLEVDIEALPTSLEDLVRAMDISVTAPESAKFSIASQGMGTRSLAAVLVFRSYVNAVRSRLDGGRTLNLSAFEEPEAHLHPQSQRAIFGLLAGIGGQKVISTHSSHVASVAELEDYRLFRRSGSQVQVHSVPQDAFDLDARVMAHRFIQRQNPEVMFARAVGIVEGHTEAAAFRVFAEAWWPPRGADGCGVSLIYTDGGGSSKHIVPFLEMLSIPWVIFCDGDRAADKGLGATSKAIGRALTRSSATVVQLPAGKAWEEALIDEGFIDAAEAATKRLGHRSLETYAVEMDGKDRKGGGKRDYSGPDRLKLAAIDYLCSEKGTIGAIFAEEVLKVRALPETPTYPRPVREFFTKLDAVLESKKP